MRVEIFGSEIKKYKQTFDAWLADHKDLDIRHISVGMGPSGEFVSTFIFFEEKSSESKPQENT
jgi:hypothetical protein